MVQKSRKGQVIKREIHKALYTALILDHHEEIGAAIFQIFQISDIDERIEDLEKYLFIIISKKSKHKSYNNMLYAHKVLVNRILEIYLIIFGG